MVQVQMMLRRMGMGCALLAFLLAGCGGGKEQKIEVVVPSEEERESANDRTPPTKSFQERVGDVN